MRKFRNVSHSFARRLEQCDVTVAEWVVLREMHAAGVTRNTWALPSCQSWYVTEYGAVVKLP